MLARPSTGILCALSLVLLCLRRTQGKANTDYTFGPALPDSCVDMGVTGTLNGITFPLVRCLPYEPLPDICNIVMPNYSAPILADNPNNMVITNALKCDGISQDYTMSKTEEIDDPYKYCWEKCRSWSKRLCRSVGILFFNSSVAESRKTPICRVSNCHGQETEDTGGRVVKAYADSTYVESRIFWNDDMSNCRTTLETWLPPTAAPTAAPTIAEDLGMFYDNPIESMAVAGTATISDTIGVTLESCATKCLKDEACVGGFNYRAEGSKCTLLLDFTESDYVDEEGSVLYPRNDLPAPTAAPTVVGQTYRPTASPTAPTLAPTRKPTQDGETWVPTGAPSEAPTAAAEETSGSLSIIAIIGIALGASVLLAGSSIAVYYYRISSSVATETKIKKKTGKHHRHHHGKHDSKVSNEA